MKSRERATNQNASVGLAGPVPVRVWDIAEVVAIGGKQRRAERLTIAGFAVVVVLGLAGLTGMALSGETIRASGAVVYTQRGISLPH